MVGRILALLIITHRKVHVCPPQLLSAALIGVALAFAIGWEDRVFEGLMESSDANDVFGTVMVKLVMMTVANFSVCLAFVGAGGVA